MPKVKSVLSDPRYVDFVKRYRFDFNRFAVEMVDFRPSWQQRLLIDSVQKPGSLTSCASGHGTGKTSLTAVMLIAFMLTIPYARVIIIANNARQVQIGVFKYLKIYWHRIVERAPWIAKYFTLTETKFYENSAKGVWESLAKTCRIGNEEALAGEHSNDDSASLTVVDEASGVGDKVFSVILGSLTGNDNRMLLLSQPTRPTGFFYETHHSLAKPRGNWNPIVLSSEESPHVTVKFLLNKRLEYSGRDSIEYTIKVKGEFPQSVSGMLLGRDALDKSARLNIQMPNGWGWVALIDVGNGRDSSVLNICKIWGQRNERILKSIKITEQASTIDPVRFADIIHAECSDDLYPNVMFVVDSDGVGYDTATCLERFGRRVQRIRWGKKMFSTSDKQRFFNQRAFANIMARDAVNQGRMQVDKNVKTLEQASKIPYAINEGGAIVMMPKKTMKEKYNIKSPDRWDTFCFGMLADYVPAEMELLESMVEKRKAVESWVTEALETDEV